MLSKRPHGRTPNAAFTLDSSNGAYLLNSFLDAGYDYDEVREVAAGFGYTTHIRCRGEEKQAKKEGQKARRWVVERTHSWLNRFRRLLIRWDKKAKCYLALLHFACAILTWNKCLFG